MHRKKASFILMVYLNVLVRLKQSCFKRQNLPMGKVSTEICYERNIDRLHFSFLSDVFHKCFNVQMFYVFFIASEAKFFFTATRLTGQRMITLLIFVENDMKNCRAPSNY